MTEDYCRDKAAPPGSNFYYSTLFHPQLVRLSFYTLHAFATEIDQVITECSEPDLARIKLQWWHEELQHIYAGQARHPVGKSLALLIEQHSIPADHLHQFVTYTGQKLIQARPGSYKELMNFLQQGPGLLWQMSAEICTFNNAKTPGLSNELGCLIEIFYIIQNIHREARQGHILLPLDEMSNVGISPNDLTNMDNKKLIDFYIHQVKKT